MSEKKMANNKTTEFITLLINEQNDDTNTSELAIKFSYSLPLTSFRFRWFRLWMKSERKYEKKKTKHCTSYQMELDEK